MCGSVGRDCIIFSKYVDHSLKISLQGGKKCMKMIGEREIAVIRHFHFSLSLISLTKETKKVKS